MMEVMSGVSVGVPLSCGSWVANFHHNHCQILICKSGIKSNETKIVYIIHMCIVLCIRMHVYSLAALYITHIV